MTTIAIFGLGLIGGSIGLDLKSQLNVHVLGVDNNAENSRLAKALNLVHEIVDEQTAFEKAEVIILAFPVDAIEQNLDSILDRISNQTTVIDVGSTKASICKVANTHKNRAQFVAAHPLAGTEFSGPNAALKGLFVNKKNIICEKDKSSKNALEIALKIFTSLGMETYFLGAQEHDKHLAYVSHLSHLSSFTLSLTVLDIEKDESQIFNLASTGFESTVRLAKSNPETWIPIFTKNKTHLLDALTRYTNFLDAFKKALETEDKVELNHLMESANSIKGVLNK